MTKYIKILIISLPVLLSSCAELFVNDDAITFTAPTDLSILKISSTIFRFKWKTTNDNSTSYELWQRTGSETYHIVKSLTSYGIVDGTVSLVDTIKDPSKTYYYSIKARQDRIVSKFSNEVNTKNADSIFVGLNTAPSNMKIDRSADNTYALSWDYTKTDANGFEIWRKKDNGMYSLLKKVPLVVLATIDSVDSPSSTYYYKVRAYRDTLISAFSNEVNTLTWTLVPAPSNFQAFANGSGKVRFSWIDNSIDETSFEIRYRNIYSTAWESKNFLRNTESALIENLGSGITCKFQIRALSDKGVSIWSSEIPINIVGWDLAVPTLSAVYDTAKTQIKLSLTNLGTSISYVIERKSGSERYKQVFNSSQLNFTDADIKSGITYTYRATAYSSDKNYSNYTEEIKITVK